MVSRFGHVLRWGVFNEETSVYSKMFVVSLRSCVGGVGEFYIHGISLVVQIVT